MFALIVDSGKHISIDALADAVLALSGVELAICREKSRVGDIKDSYADISKAKHVLGYKPQISLNNGLRLLLKEGSDVKTVG